MARTRLIKPQFFTNEVLGALPPLARLLFIGLWCLADREGRLHDRPQRIAVEILPYDAADVEALLRSLSDAGFIQRYQVKRGRYIQVITFTRHQSPHIHERNSTIPAPYKHGASTGKAAVKPRAKQRARPVQAPDKHRDSTLSECLDPLTLNPDPVTLDPLHPDPDRSRTPAGAGVIDRAREQRAPAAASAASGALEGEWVIDADGTPWVREGDRLVLAPGAAAPAPRRRINRGG